MSVIKVDYGDIGSGDVFAAQYPELSNSLGNLTIDCGFKPKRVYVSAWLNSGSVYHGVFIYDDDFCKNTGQIQCFSTSTPPSDSASVGRFYNFTESSYGIAEITNTGFRMTNLSGTAYKDVTVIAYKD